MSTPKQPHTMIDTEYGPAKIIDFRDHDKPDESPRLYLDKVTINRVEYTDVTVSIFKRNTGEVAAMVSGNWRKALSDSASRKLEAVVLTPELLKVYEPFLEPLDEHGVRASLKHRVAYDVLYTIGKSSSNRYYPDDEGRAKDALLDEILYDILKARARGTHFSDIEL